MLSRATSRLLNLNRPTTVPRAASLSVFAASSSPFSGDTGVGLSRSHHICVSNATRNAPSNQTSRRAMATAASASISNPAMFCRQCEQTQDHIACRSVGICGKTPETSAMQDGLVHTLKCMGLWCVAARQAGATSEEMYEANWWTLKSAFSTLTNVNFDEERIAEVSL